MPFYYKSHDKPAPNGFVKFVRQIYRPLGFKRGYNFPLWIIFAGAALGFCASRAMYLDIDGTYARAKVVTGDWYYQVRGHNHVGIAMHLACVVPIGFLIPWQFVPKIREKALLFHRINGYILSLLLLFADVGALMIARRGLGGDLAIQVLSGVLAIMTVGGLAMAIYNVKVQQLDQHRAWMLRTWFYAFSIITLRIVMTAAINIISKIDSYYLAWPCEVIESIYQDYGIPVAAAKFYAACAANPSGIAAVKATQDIALPHLESIGAVTDISFGMSGIVSVFLHAVGIEIYLHLTPGEAARLKRVSYERQKARGYKNPGNAGFTAQKWGDAEEFDFEGPGRSDENALHGRPQFGLNTDSESGLSVASPAAIEEKV